MVIVLLFAFLGSLYFETFGFKASMPDLRAELSYYTTVERFHNGTESWGREGTIHIMGWIYNYGPEDVNVTVHLWVTDGTKNGGGIGVSQSEYWQSYYIYIGVVPGNGGRRWFEWEQRYNPFDPTTATFYYKLIPRALARGAP
ncbi:hypothetical protein CW700_05425 [Candidatus Bathyarchaeota archaeon]|nr:MAG: hypothetical protein CW700_05425 [Candidatus Bathyarchaeota archaeon]